MARYYDVKTNIFSPEGRLYQVEYAMEAISIGGTCIGIVAEDGAILIAQKKAIEKLLDDSEFSEKIYKINDDMMCSIAGVTSDAHVLINELRLINQRYELYYGEKMSCEESVTELCNIKQGYTQYGGKRPFGVSILYIGWDKKYGYQLYQSNPSGNYEGWIAACIGNKSILGISLLEQEQEIVDKKINLEQAKNIALKIFYKIVDTVELTANEIEMATLIRKDNKTVIKIFTDNEIEEVIKKYEGAN